MQKFNFDIGGRVVAVALLAFLGMAPESFAASSSGVNNSRTSPSTSQFAPGSRARSSGAGSMAPDAGPRPMQNNGTRYAPTAPPVPGSAQDPYGNSSGGSGSGASGSSPVR